MSLRVFLPLVVLALGVGFAAGLIHTRRTIDGGPATGPGDGAAARQAWTRLREEASLGGSPAALATQRRVFLERWPESWLRRHWAASTR